MIKSKCYPRRCIKGLHHSEFKTQNFIDNVCGNCEIPDKLKEFLKKMQIQPEPFLGVLNVF